MIMERFEVLSRFRNTGLVLLIIGIATLIGGFAGLLARNDHDRARFWIVLLQNSVFFLFIAMASIFIRLQAVWHKADGSYLAVVLKRQSELTYGSSVLSPWSFCSAS